MQEHTRIDSKFRLVILAARRAKQIIGGNKKKVDIKADNPLTIALKELEEGKISFEIIEGAEVEIGSEKELEMEFSDEKVESAPPDPQIEDEEIPEE